MTLDNFRTIDIFWNHAKMKITKALRVASSDDKGRKLVVQIYDDHVQKNMSGVSLRLYWENRDKTSGFHNFKLVDAGKGIYEIYYPRDLLANKGSIKSWLHLTDSTGSITSEPFTVSVFDGIDLSGIEASDSLQALTDALIQINQYQANIDRILADLEADYGPKMDGLEKQFNDAIANLTQDSEVIAGRTSTMTGESYDSIGKRLDEMEVSRVFNDRDTGETHLAKFYIEDGHLVMETEES